MNKLKRTPAIIPPSKYGFTSDPSDFDRASTVAFAIIVIAGSVGSVSCGKGLVFDFIAFIAAKYSYIYIYIYSYIYIMKIFSEKLIRTSYVIF